MFGFIYVTTNLVNGKKYIGQCRYGKKGWESYLGSGRVLKKAIAKYGCQNFSREVIAEADSRELLTELENKFLSEFNAAEDQNWYNMQSKAYASLGFTGRKHSEFRNKMVSDKLKGRSRPAHVGEAVRKARTGHVKTIEATRKQGASLKARWADPEFRAKMLAARKASQPSP